MRTTTVVVAMMTALAHGAHADDSVPAGDTLGHFPLLQVGVAGGFSGVPIGYVNGTGADALDETDSSFAGLVGPDAIINVDARAALLYFEGIYSPLGELQFVGRARIVFAKGLGLRTTANLVQSISDSTSGGYTTTTTTYYVHKHVPVIFGVSGGVSLINFRESATTSYGAGDPSYTRDPATFPTASAGLTLKSPQLELVLEPTFTPTTSSYGLQWVFGMAFPIGDKPLWFKFTGDHMFGGDPVDNTGRRMSFFMMMSLGFGTSLGTG